ncbi:MAG: hypothetical protein ACLUHA_17145 [Bacteroides stercoris]
MIVSDPHDKTTYHIKPDSQVSVNWTSVQFFQWALYNPGSDVLPVTFKLTDIQEVENYLSYTEQSSKLKWCGLTFGIDRNLKAKKRISSAGMGQL